MVVCLYGILGVYNFGCEAIVRGSYKFIRDLYPDAEIRYMSYSYEYDKNALRDLDISIYPIRKNNYIFKRIVNRFCRIFNIEKRWMDFDINLMLKGIDVIFSIGGDIYTIPAYKRNKKRYQYYNHLIDFCDKAINRGIKVIVYGASVGPWGEYKKAVDYYVRAMQKYELILCREQESVDYLNTLNFKNVIFFPDPAFYVKAENENKEVEKKYIGINLSPLSFNEVFGNHAFYDDLSKLMDKLVDAFHFELLMIPHVLSNDEDDNDLIFLKEIVSKMSHKDQVVFADDSNGFFGAKRVMSSCYAVVAARMHCGINAVEQSIPTIFISYSQKALGMSRYIYQSDDMCISIQELESKLLDRLSFVLENLFTLQKQLEVNNEKVQNYYNFNIKKIKKILSLVDSEMLGECNNGIR